MKYNFFSAVDFAEFLIKTELQKICNTCLTFNEIFKRNEILFFSAVDFSEFLIKKLNSKNFATLD